MPHSVLAYVGSLAAIAVAALAVSAAEITDGPGPVWWQLAVCVGLVFAATIAEFSSRLGSQRFQLVWTESAFAVALWLLPYTWAVVAFAAGVTIAAFPQRSETIKAVFNISMDTVAVAGIVLLLHLVHGPIDRDGLSDLFTVVVASLVFGFVTHFATTVVIGLSQRRSIAAVYRQTLVATILSTLGNIAATAIVLLVAQVDDRVLVVLPPLLLSLRQAYLARLRGREERESWQGLLEASGWWVVVAGVGYTVWLM